MRLECDPLIIYFQETWCYGKEKVYSSRFTDNTVTNRFSNHHSVLWKAFSRPRSKYQARDLRLLREGITVCH